jgi:hypothetical protein
VGALLVVLVLYVQIQVLNVLRLRVTSVLVESKVVISKLSLILAHIFDESLILPLEGKVLSVVLVYVLDLLLHLANLPYDLVVLTLQEIQVVIAIVNLAARTLVLNLDAGHAVVGDGPVDGGHLRVVADA